MAKTALPINALSIIDTHLLFVYVGIQFSSIIQINISVQQVEKTQKAYRKEKLSYLLAKYAISRRGFGYAYTKFKFCFSKGSCFAFYLIANVTLCVLNKTDFRI